MTRHAPGVRRLAEFAQILGSAAVIYGLRLGGAALTFLTQWLLVRFMGEAELGRYLFIFALASVAGFVCTLGLPIVATRILPPALEQGDHGLVRGFLRHTAWSIAAASLLLVLAAALVLAWRAGPGTPMVEITGWALGLAMVPVSAALIAQSDIGRAAFLLATAFAPAMLLRHVVTFLGVAGLGLAGVALNAAWALGLTLAGMGAAAALQFALLRRRIAALLGPAPPRTVGTAWLRTGLPLVFAFGVSGFFLEINVALAGVVVPPAELAVYALSLQIVNLVGFFLTAVGFQLAPHAARLHGLGDREGLQRAIARASLVRGAVTLPALAALLLMGPPLLGLFGPAFAAATPVLVVLALTQVTSALFGPVEELVPLFDLEDSAARIALGVLVLDALLTALLAPAFGIMGAAVSALLTMAAWDIALLLAIRRATGLKTSLLEAGRLFARPAAA